MQRLVDIPHTLLINNIILGIFIQIFILIGYTQPLGIALSKKSLMSVLIH